MLNTALLNATCAVPQEAAAVSLYGAETPRRCERIESASGALIQSESRKPKAERRPSSMNGEIVACNYSNKANYCEL